MKKVFYLIMIIITGSLISCSEDYLEPTTDQYKLIEEQITDTVDYKNVLTSAYDRLTSTYYYGRDFIIYGEVRTDNAYANGNSARFVRISDLNMIEGDGYAGNTWAYIYRVIASANIIIKQDTSKIEGNNSRISHVLGQAYTLRALAHFDLLKLYGQQHVTGGNNVGIPYMEDYVSKISDFDNEYRNPARLSVDQVKEKLYADLDKAVALMDPAHDDGSKQYITSNAANALLSRVALYFGDWNRVIPAAEAVINSMQYEIIDSADFVESWIIDGAKNSIFELAYDNTDNNDINGLQYIYRSASYGDIVATYDLEGIFDAGDVRRSYDMFHGDGTYWRNYGKYPSSDYSDNIPLIRYEEVILNYAEALFRIDPLDTDALDYLNMVPAKRGASLYSSVNEDNILLERRKELCFEGFRFDDLARTKRDLYTKDVSYGDYRYAFPIPISELNSNSNEGMTQNVGY